MNNSDSQKPVRIDKWLWAARFYKTRQLAVKAIKNGKIHVNSQRIKPAFTVKLQDKILIKRGVYEIELHVLQLNEQRGSATIAQTMYQESSQSLQRRQQLQQELARQPKINIERGKPDKRGVRRNLRLKRGE